MVYVVSREESDFSKAESTIFVVSASKSAITLAEMIHVIVSRFDSATGNLNRQSLSSQLVRKQEKGSTVWSGPLLWSIIGTAVLLNGNKMRRRTYPSSAEAVME